MSYPLIADYFKKISVTLKSEPFLEKLKMILDT